MLEAENSEITAAVLERGPRDEVRFRVRRFKGRLAFDIRLFSRFDGGEDPQPTKKGVSLFIENWGEFMECIGKLGEAIRKAGWIEEDAG